MFPNEDIEEKIAIEDLEAPEVYNEETRESVLDKNETEAEVATEDLGVVEVYKEEMRESVPSVTKHKSEADCEIELCLVITREELTKEQLKNSINCQFLDHKIFVPQITAYQSFL